MYVLAWTQYVTLRALVVQAAVILIYALAEFPL